MKDLTALATQYTAAWCSQNAARVAVHDDKTIYAWTLTGTHTGPGGTGRRVRISGHEEWTFDTDGLIAHSLGFFDAADYQRQLHS